MVLVLFRRPQAGVVAAAAAHVEAADAFAAATKPMGNYDDVDYGPWAGHNLDCVSLMVLPFWPHSSLEGYSSGVAQQQQD